MTRSAAHGDFVFETALNLSAPAWIGEHRVYGTAVLPGSAYLEAALAAARQALASETLVLENVEFREALHVPERGGCTIQTVVTPLSEGAAEWRVYRRNDGGGERNGAAFTLHALGQVRIEASMNPPAGAVAEMRAACPQPMSVETLYAGFADCGLEYGPAFRGLVEMHRGADQTMGRVRLLEPTEANEYLLHPALLDACLQVCGGVLPIDASTAYLPIGVESLRLHARPTAALWCRARLRPGMPERSPSFDLELIDEQDGRRIATVEGLRLQRAERESLQRAKASPLDDLAFRAELVGCGTRPCGARAWRSVDLRGCEWRRCGPRRSPQGGRRDVRGASRSATDTSGATSAPSGWPRIPRRNSRPC